MSAITTHILDLAQGCPAEGVKVTLEFSAKKDKWDELASGKTNSDGRVAGLLAKDHKLKPGTYRLTFAVGSYFKKTKTESFYEDIPVVFVIGKGQAHYHVPLLLSPFGYSTYRGS